MDQQKYSGLSPTVVKVLDEFTNVLYHDKEIPDPVINRLNDLLRKGTVPKSEEINNSVFHVLNEETE